MPWSRLPPWTYRTQHTTPAWCSPSGRAEETLWISCPGLPATLLVNKSCLRSHCSAQLSDCPRRPNCNLHETSKKLCQQCAWLHAPPLILIIPLPLWGSISVICETQPPPRVSRGAQRAVKTQDPGPSSGGAHQRNGVGEPRPLLVLLPVLCCKNSKTS